MIVINVNTRTVTSLLALWAVAASARADINSLLSQWNVVTFGDLQQVTADIQGRTFVGGNVTWGNSFTVAAGNSSVQPGDITFAVQGSVGSGGAIHVNSGSVVLGGSSSPSRFNLNSHGSVTAASSWPGNNSPLSQLASASFSLSQAAANGTLSINAANQVSFVAPANQSVAVFNVTDAATFERANLQGFDLVPASSTTTFLINVNSADGVVNWQQGNFFNLFQQANWRGRVLFNFYNAKTITLHDQFCGYLLAPGADVTAANIDGGVVADGLKTTSEIHLPDSGSTTESSWYGSLVVPEPSSAALLLGGLLLMGRGRGLRKRSARN